jgi:hypothetical protein
MVDNTKETDNDELMIVITPHVIANNDLSAAEIWINEK